MRQWAVDLSGEGYRSGIHYSYLYADWTADLFSRRVRMVLHERPAARIDGCCPCCGQRL
jgi:hypothetical protein